MDIEKLIEELRDKVSDMQDMRADMNGRMFSGIIITGNEACALLTEIDYWRTRCGAAEAVFDFVQEPEITNCARPAWDAYQDARNGESNKQAWLYGIPSAPVE